jgi:hypothetical protein
MAQVEEVMTVEKDAVYIGGVSGYLATDHQVQCGCGSGRLMP